MGFFANSAAICPKDHQHCSQWAQKYMNYCLCGTKDGVSLGLGLISVISWGVAEIPQIVTNYKENSAEGLSIAFLMTWILGPAFGVSIPQPPLTLLYNMQTHDSVFTGGLDYAKRRRKLETLNSKEGDGGFIGICKMLPTQYYMALLYTVTTLILSAQAIYYGYIYHRLKCNGRSHNKELKNNVSECDIQAKELLVEQCSYNVPSNKEAVNKQRQHSNLGKKQFGSSDGLENGRKAVASGFASTLPIPLPVLSHNGSLERELYYTSARSLSRSHTPTVGFHLQRRSTSVYEQNPSQEPLLGAHKSSQSAPPSKAKIMLCVVSSLTFFLEACNLHLERSNKTDMVFQNPNQGVVVQVGRKLLQVSGSLLQETGNKKNGGIGTFLGWGMAAIYMGGRLPQICLNIRRGNVESSYTPDFPNFLLDV
ncbi:hypothetical protein RJ639_029230 [Escallonia herrerae]|uniref:Uncharacterized protein n=1 Tax=Escallonia herrerae TaxID=1293975 RepID=A0AA88X4L3_9ASTE|nr:hypothetical protein RJ639_029230 [Escallonia herrerae]